MKYVNFIVGDTVAVQAAPHIHGTVIAVSDGPVACQRADGRLEISEAATVMIEDRKYTIALRELNVVSRAPAALREIRLTGD